MRRHTIRQLAGATLVLALMALPACGEDTDTDTDTDGQGGLTAEEVAALLVTAEDLGKGWSVMEPEGDQLFPNGVVTDETRAMLPQMQFCDEADEGSQQVAEDLQWQAFRQLGFETSVPEREPGDKTRPQHHLVFAQEFLLSDDAATIEDTFDVLAAGIEACAGTTETTPDGESIDTSLLDVPDLGDDAVGTRLIVTEPGPAKGAPVWDLRNVIVRDGEMLVVVTFVEITTPKIEPEFSDADVEEILSTVVDRLP